MGDKRRERRMRARANTEGDPVILFLSDEISGMYVLTRLPSMKNHLLEGEEASSSPNQSRLNQNREG